MLASFSLLTRASLVVSRERLDCCSSSTVLRSSSTRVRQAHLDLGQALPDGDGVVAAGVVAAGPAVELVLGAALVHAREDLLELLLRRHVVEALVERRERAREVDVGVLGDRLLPRDPVEAGLAGAGDGADVRAALEHRLLAAEAGAHDAALAAEDVQQARLGVAVLEVGDRVDEVLTAVGAHDVAAQQVLVEVRRLEHAARDGEEGAEAAVRRVEVLAGLLAPAEAHAARGEQGAELHVGERRVDLALELLVARLALLGDAGPDEHDLELRARTSCAARARSPASARRWAPAGRGCRGGTCARS